MHECRHFIPFKKKKEKKKEKKEKKNLLADFHYVYVLFFLSFCCWNKQPFRNKQPVRLIN